MNKSDLIKAFVDETKVSDKVGSSIIETILDKMTESLIQGESIELRGFGSFTIKKYEGYEGRNPKTGVVTIVKPKKLPFFKPGKALRESVNSNRRTVSKAKNKK
jgi:integration host factor subunit beta